MNGDKKLVWVGSARKDIQGFPQEVRAVFGVALYWAQMRRLSRIWI